MLPREFIKKHNIKLSKAEARLCRDAMHMMYKSFDVNHDESHVYRMLDYLDEFMADREYEDLKNRVDLKIVMIAIIWHDTWKSERDPKSVIMLLPDMVREGICSALKFTKAAKKAGISEETIKKIKYIIRKHSSFQILLAKTLEAKLLHDFDLLDCFSFDRIYLMEKKYMCDRPLNWSTLRLAQFAAKVFVKNKKEKDFNFLWSQNNFRQKQKDVLDKIMPEIAEYKQLLEFLDNNQQLEFEKMYCYLKDKYLNKPELLKKPEDPF